MRNAEKNLNWEEIASCGVDKLPLVKVESNGWIIQFKIMPKKQEAWGKPGSKAIGAGLMEVGWSQTKSQLRDEIRGKRRQHMGIDKPLIVAVNAGQLDSDAEDKFDALYGSEQWVLNEDLSSVAHVTRDLDGIWLGRQGVKNSHMPYVLMGNHVNPWSFPNLRLEQFSHPFQPIDATVDLPRIPRWVNNGGKAEYVEGETLGEILGVKF